MDEAKVSQEITEDCGHHCGLIQIGKSYYVGHCGCPECHNRTVS